MDLSGKQIAVLGAGRSGRAAAQLALHLGATVTVYDAAGLDVFGAIPSGAELRPNATVEMGLDCKADLVVISPGIETGGEFAAAFADGAGELIGETEFASRLYKGRVVGITGTNGKTTTTELVQRVLNAGGVSCEACGNYGRPLADVVLDEKHPAAVALELSSFQLETIATFRPDVSVWLNFSPDHMDRYESIEDYRAAKLRIFENQTEEDTAVVKLGEPLGDLRPMRVSFSASENGGDFELRGATILKGGQKVLDLSKTRLRGLHNAENVMAALGAGEVLGVSFATAAEALIGYAPPLHRCELVGTLDGVEYINDSKATNLHALESALLSQDRPTVLIAGGKEKELDYKPLLSVLAGRVEAVVVFGEIRDRLHRLFSEVVVTSVAENLREAVTLARGAARPGGTVLFSPGTSSFDMFSGYEERGDAFRAAVQALK